MSHVVTIQTKVKDKAAIAAACHRLKLTPPREGIAQLYSQRAEGLLVQLPGWQYPAVVDLASGAVQYDNFGGRWGAQCELDRFLQAYAVEKASLEARRQGHQVTEEQLQDGSIKLHIAVDH